MSKDEEPSTWFDRIKQFLHNEPQNRDELIKLLREAESRALIDSDTLSMIESIILLSQMKVRDVMLPKKQMVSISEEATIDEIIRIVTESGHSRFPVIGDSSDEVIGILHAKDLLKFQLPNVEKTQFDLDDVIRQTAFVPESKRLDLLLREFRMNRNHMAVVVDEYGSVAGFITLEDILEQIIGDIEDEFDIDEEAYIKVHTDSQYIIKPRMPLEEFNEAFNTHFSGEHYDTVGGLVIANFGYLPTRGEIITIDQFEFKILNADARTVKLLECKDLRKAINKKKPKG